MLQVSNQPPGTGHVDAAREPVEQVALVGVRGRAALEEDVRASAAASSSAASQPGAARQSSSVNATSGASVARQPRLRFAVGPATSGRVR